MKNKAPIWIKWNYSDDNWLCSDSIEEYEYYLRKFDINLEHDDEYYSLSSHCPIGELIRALDWAGVEPGEFAIYV